MKVTPWIASLGGLAGITLGASVDVGSATAAFREFGTGAAVVGLFLFAFKLMIRELKSLFDALQKRDAAQADLQLERDQKAMAMTRASHEQFSEVLQKSIAASSAQTEQLRIAAATVYTVTVEQQRLVDLLQKASASAARRKASNVKKKKRRTNHR